MYIYHLPEARPVLTAVAKTHKNKRPREDCIGQENKKDTSRTADKIPAIMHWN